MEMKQEFRQVQTMNQKMIQNIEILSMSAQELEEYIREFSLENPVVDLEKKEEIPSDEADRRKKLEWLNATDSQNRVYYTQDYDEDSRDEWNFEEKKGESLADYLFSQLVDVDMPKEEYEILKYMIYSLDSRGYLKEDLQELERIFGKTEYEIEKVLIRLQNLEPAGVGARDLRECLLLQLKRKGNKNIISEKIVCEYLSMLGKNQLSALAKKLKISMEELSVAVKIIQELNPKPGNSFSSRENLRYIVPDVTIVKFTDYYQILINEYTYPEIHVNRYYKNLLQEDGIQETKDYVEKKIRQIEWVKDCISQRNATMLKVTEVIVERQKKFFAEGPGNLVPLKLCDIADEVGVHESTVSRALKDKYLQCSWGVYPMNYFLSTAIERVGAGSQISTEQIKYMIRELIETENKNKPYSDRILTELLREKDVKISRRTVAKYRETMGILDAAKRKKF